MFIIDQVQENLYCLSSLKTGSMVWVDAHNGMNVVRLCYEKADIILCDAERQSQGATYAIPILYPCPNRVANGFFVFEKQKVFMPMHGVVRCAVCKIVSCNQSETAASITGVFDFSKESLLFEKFPYLSDLTVRITLTEHSVRWNYWIHNKGDKTLPYSFALHPFFLQRGETRIRTSAGNVMQMTQDKLPTGEIVAVKGTKKDLSQWISPQKIQLDDVFCAEQNPKASIFYCDDKIRVDLNTSDEFKRLVVYTPPNKCWFCLENQTSSTDCHNLHEKGFREAAHLQTVLPHSEKAGFIQFDFKRERIK